MTPSTAVRLQMFSNYAFQIAKLTILCNCKLTGSRDGAMVRDLASHQCGPSSIPGLGVICGGLVICGLSLLLVLVLAPGCFSLGSWVFPSSQTPAFQIPIRSGI